MTLDGACVGVWVVVVATNASDGRVPIMRPIEIRIKIRMVAKHRPTKHDNSLLAYRTGFRQSGAPVNR